MPKGMDEQMRMWPLFGPRADRARLPRRRRAVILIVAAIAVTASIALGQAVANDSATSLDQPVGRTLAPPIPQPSSTVGAGATSFSTSVDSDTAREPRATAEVSDLLTSRARSVESPSDNAASQTGSEVGVAVDVEVERSVEDGQDRAAVTVRLRTQIDDQEDDGHTFATLYCDTGQVSATVCETVDNVGPVRVHAEIGASSEPHE